MTPFTWRSTLHPYGRDETAPRTRGLMWWGLAAVVIVAGFADLARGGETIAPILLAVGYCVLVPIAILK